MPPYPVPLSHCFFAALLSMKMHTAGRAAPAISDQRGTTADSTSDARAAVLVSASADSG
jgi:hypothetical protein